MSPHINSLVGDLVAMAQAMEKVPHLEDQINAMRSQLEASQSHNQGLESNIISYKQQIEDLNSKVRSLEVERDDASFRVLEAEDKTASILQEASVMRTHLDTLIAFVDPPKPQPEPTKVEYKAYMQPQAVELSNDHGSLPEPKPETFSGFEPKGSSESSPIGEQQAGLLAETPQLPQGSSEAYPTAKEESTSSEIASSLSASSTVADTTAGTENKGPYSNKRYHDMPTYISYFDWLDGGGTEADYYWRPSRDNVF